ncbi:MAG: potassium channel family protein [Bacillota bacterium]
MNIIIVGCGRTGSAIAAQMSAEGHDTAIIDLNPLAFNRLPPDYPGRLIVGTGIDEDVLHNAGIESASALVAITKGDNTNIMIGQIAKFIYRVPKVMVRIVDPKVKKFYEEKFGLSCYCPTEENPGHFIRFIKGEEQCMS